MSRADVTNLFKDQIVKRGGGRTKSEEVNLAVTPKDAGLDSLDTIEMAMELEEATGIPKEVLEQKMGPKTTIAELVDATWEAMEKKMNPA